MMAWLNTLLPGLSFGAPVVLWALLALPAIYWLLRVTPPAPKRIVFPPLRLLFGLISPEETPARTPWWLLLMRLFAAAIAIIALAEPVYDATPAKAGDGPLVLVIDNDWAAAQQWQSRVNAMHSALAAATRAGRPVTIIATAEPHPLSVQWMTPGTATSTADDIAPEPWLPDRAKAVAALKDLKPRGRAQILWLSDGLNDPAARKFADALAKFGDLSIYADPANLAPLGMRPPDNGANGFGVTLIRANADDARDGRVAAIDGRGRTLESAPFHFPAGAGEAKATITLPLELRNTTARIAVEGSQSAGTVQLVDSRYRRRPVGLVAGNPDTEQPLLSDLFYVERALQPYAEIRKGTIDQVVQSGIAVLILADIGQLTSTQHDEVTKFVRDGGMLLRFAGPRLATANATDDLLPVKLRVGERLMGSALAWAKPQHLAPFGENSPYHGLAVPNDVTVSRQVLAEPSITLADHTWARLTDGTPLVTANQMGKGWIVLFHVAASPGWSNLPLSGLYVDMLRRTIAMSGGIRGAAAERTGTYPPYQSLNGFGDLVRAFPEALAMKAADFDTMVPGPQHPPGLYGNQGGVVALNAVNDKTQMQPLATGRNVFAYEAGGIMRLLKWPLLEIVLLILLFDALISLSLRGYLTIGTLRGATRKAALGLLLAAGVALVPHGAKADEAKDRASALEARLAYVITGNADVDEMSRAGLFGLGLQLRARTAYEPADPVGVDIATDDLAFYPLLYWPMTPEQKDLTPKEVAKVDAYMQNGGTILFDTLDGKLSDLAGGALSPGEATLRRLLSKLDIPPLQPIPPDHVLTKTFYLLKEFPGRWIGGQVWVEALPKAEPGQEARPARGGDGVSPVIIGGNDWAAAWALDQNAKPIAAVVPGGDEQREMAVRFGINVVMYAMTGNYKTDQVHVPDLLERLGK